MAMCFRAALTLGLICWLVSAMGISAQEMAPLAGERSYAYASYERKPVTAPQPSARASDLEGLEKRLVQIRLPHPQIEEYWTAASGTLVLRSNVALTAAHTFYRIEDLPGGRCGCEPRLQTSGPNAISGMKDVRVKLFQPHHAGSGYETQIEQAFPDNHCRYVKPVRGKCIIPPEHDFTALRLSGFLPGGQPIDLSPLPEPGYRSVYRYAGFPSELDDQLVGDTCAPGALGRSTRPGAPVQVLAGKACTAAKGMSGGPVYDILRDVVGRTYTAQRGILLATQQGRIIYRRRDEQVDRCVRSAAEYDATRGPANTLVSLGYAGDGDCPAISR